MKKLFALIVCILLLFTLASCGEDPCQHRDADDNSLCDNCGESYTDGKDLTDGHTHNYTVKNTDSKYLYKAADCENAATYFYSCSCGDKGTETFASGEAKGHSFVVENVDIKYQHTPASEYSPAIYYKSCACGKASTTETFTHGDMLPGYLTYQLSSDSSFYIVSGYVGAKSNISVPNLHDGLPVFEIMANAFKDNTTVKSITMPNSIIEIGSYAFAGCTSLESIIIPTSVTNISPYTFSGCTALKTITLHSGIKTLGSFAFEKCSALKSITLNEGLETISDNAFDYCTSLESISIPDTVTTLGNMAFRHAESLRSVKFSSELKSIGNATFQYCVKLESVTLHENINTLGSSTFSYCDGLESVRILGDLTNIGTATFYECRSLTSIYFASKTSGNCGNTNYIFYNAGIEGAGITLTIAKDAVIPDGFFTPYVEDNMPKITKIVIEDGNMTVNGFENYNKLPYLTGVTYPNTITDSAYGAFNNSLWWDNQEIGEVFINGIFYGYKCHCKLATPADAVTENYVDSTCTEDGHYDSVIYCSVCNDELKRTNTVIEKGHSPKSAVEENRVGASCTEDVHYDSVIYCSVCNEELSRETITIPAGHIIQNGTCTKCKATFYTRGGNYIYFGEYPQTLKADGVTITTTIDSRGYYLGSDGFYYAKVVADPNSSSYTFSTGATVTDGATYYFKVEPIRWRILSTDGETALILCDSIIANHRYDDSSNNYKDSEIRAWLNATFYETAFTELQREIILTTTVDNSVASTGYSGNPYACENTEDKIFLLSYKEVTNSAYGFHASFAGCDTARRMETSDYSRATGASMSTSSYDYGNCPWWLRSAYGHGSRNARGVSSDGSTGYYYSVSFENFGVVPALWIRL